MVTITGKALAQIILVAALISSIHLVALSLDQTPVYAVNNSNVTTLVNVTNTEPRILQLNLTPSSINLNPGGTVNVTCRAEVFDYNGFQDFNTANAVLFHQSVQYSSPDDNNNHYTISNQTCVRDSHNATSYFVNCTANLFYYATNGTWNCSMFVSDDGGAKNPDVKFNTTFNASIGANVSQLLAIDVPAVLNYGNLTVTQTSAEQPFNITNYGNVPLNLSVRGYAANNDARNLSMVCDFGAINVTNQHYTISAGTSFDNMNLLTNVTTLIRNFTLPQRTNDTWFGSDRNSTYWRLQIPLTVGGNCNGTLRFTASYATP